MSWRQRQPFKVPIPAERILEDERCDEGRPHVWVNSGSRGLYCELTLSNY